MKIFEISLPRAEESLWRRKIVNSGAASMCEQDAVACYLQRMPISRAFPAS